MKETTTYFFIEWCSLILFVFGIFIFSILIFVEAIEKNYILVAVYGILGAILGSLMIFFAFRNLYDIIKKKEK